MRVAIMQPYFLPYVGYYQLIGAVDLFIVYDNIKYTKKGWINRNRLLLNGKDATFSLPLKHDSDALDVRDRELANTFSREKLLNHFREAYRRAPFFEQTFSLLEGIVRYERNNLFDYLHHSVVAACNHLGIDTEIRISSTVPIDHSLKSQDKVLALCRSVGADVYINAVGGIDLYSREVFRNCGIELRFIRPMEFAYRQFGAAFVPWLSIVDVMMFNPLNEVAACIASNYELV
jgi:hypothetical protein